MVLLHGTRGPTVCFENGRKSSGRSSWKNTNGYWATRCSGTVSGGFVQKETKALQHCRDRKPCVRVNAVNAPETVEPLRFGKGSIQELPIFPLSIVAFPTSDTPLNIFEARYRVLFNTLLAGSEGIIEDLVSPDKPWAGTRLFGMCYLTQEGNMASVGTTLHIYRHVCSDDGRMMIVNKGIEKFRILEVKQERPLMICKVEVLEDEEDSSEEAKTLASEAMDLFKTFVALSIKIRQMKATGEMTGAVDNMTPREISYWLAAIFAQNAYAQQALLEEVTVKGRLGQEKQVLESITKMLQAQLAVQSALSPEEKPEEKSTDGSKSEDKPSTDKQQGEQSK